MQPLKLLLASAALLSCGVAHAADLRVPRPTIVAPVATPWSWAGFYIGAHAGYLWGDVEIEEEGELETVGGAVNGFIGGALAGFNVQSGGLVWGLEADFGLTNAHGNGVVANDIYTYDMNWNAHLRARLGLPVGRSLVFVAAGLAAAGLGIDYEQTMFGGTFVGWTAGIGVDHAFSNNLIGRLELLYDDYGSKSYGGGEPFTASLTATTVRAALIFKFGSH